MDKYIFESWTGVGRTVFVGVLAYVGLILMLRISGKRTLAKMNSFDLVVTVALGSTLATVLLTKQVPLVEGLTGFAVLILLQYVVTWSSVRSASVRKAVRSEPSLLVHRGQFLDEALRAQRVTKSEVLQAIRSQGMLNIGEVEGVVIETDGTFSVVRSAENITASSLNEIRENRSDKGNVG